MTLPALLGGPPVRPQGPPLWPQWSSSVASAFTQLVATGDWGRYHGPHGAALVAALAESHGTKHVQLCASGTAAVELALRGVSVGPGDEIILSAYDFKANFTNVVLLGALPVLVDCRSDDAQLDVDQVSAAITDKTKAMIASHLQGGLVAMAALRELADQRGIALIEDVCQAPGAIVDGRPAGAWGDVATLSFGGSKLVTAGRGGAVLTHRPEVAHRMRVYNQRGNEASPLSEMQAAILLPQWQQLDEANQERSAAVAGMRGLPGMTPFISAPRSVGPNLEVDCQPAYYKVGFWYSAAEYAGLSRERFCQALRAEGIPFDPGFAGLHQTHARRRFRAVGDLPQATRACASVVMLHHPILRSGPDPGIELKQALDKIREYATLLRDAQTNDFCGT